MHKQAALYTAKIVVFGLLGSVIGIAAVEFLTASQIMFGFASGLFVYFVYLIYSIEKSRLEILENLNRKNA